MQAQFRRGKKYIEDFNKIIVSEQAADLDERSRPEQLTLENYCALQTALANT